ncbi:hypothetical protein KOR42_47170 [Thalassoglobus neptunius]|uniref:Uncharacterized protein n=2 Tax=Thalassoglobus neptunius TaxID=1938619 RepID=A0A5C5VWN7_9PLAN|nr:hypothetical protein KOR42_47170 [Thalassoglobus neptunius]
MQYTMRTNRYRFTRWVHRDDHSKIDAVELHDHKLDSVENVNIASKPENAELVDRSTRQLLAGWQATPLTF